MNPLAACYIRVSTDEQVEHGISIPAQKSRLEAYCQAQGWDIYDFYIDDGYSGKDLQRPEVQRMINGALNKQFTLVLVLKLDRLSRKQKDVLYLLEDVFEPNNIGFKSATESFDTTNAFGKASLGMMAVFAQLERDTIIERVRLAKKESARQGRFMGGIAPFGYRYNYELKLLEIDEFQAQTIRWIYEQFRKNNHGYSFIAKSLELRRIPGPTNRFWNKQYVKKILTNPVYAGYVGHKGKLYEGNHQPIISPSIWHETQALIQGRGTTMSSQNTNIGLLSGIIWCGECGARMRSKNVWQNYPTEPKKAIHYYVCYSQDGSAKHMVKDPNCRCGYKNAGEIEEKVIHELQNYHFDQSLLFEEVNNLLIQHCCKTDSVLPTVTSVKKELLALERKIHRWYEAFEKGVLEPEQLIDRVQDLRNRKLLLEKNLIDLENQPSKKDSGIDFQDIEELFQSFLTLWDQAKPDERREITVNLVKRVTIFKDNRTEIIFN